MKCYLHPDVDAVDKCTLCGREMCAECKLDYDGKIVCKPCAMPLMNLFGPLIYGGCDCGPAAGNVTCKEYVPPGRRLIKALESTVRGRVARADLTPEEDETRKFILKSFAKNGKPPSDQQIIDELGIRSTADVERTTEKLYHADILAKKDGRIISSYPFSATETRHRVRFKDGHEVFALCAIDALGIHAMLGEDTTVISRCVECDRELRIVIEGSRIVSSIPEGIVACVNGGEACGRVSDTCCPYINFFCSDDELCQWMWTNPQFENGERYSLDEAVEYGRNIFGDMLK